MGIFLTLGGSYGDFLSESVSVSPTVSREKLYTIQITPLKTVENKVLIDPDYPVRLRIPAIHVDSAIEHVGIVGGAIDTPKNMSNVAWYQLGAIPGEKGSAIIDGHFGWVKGVPTVFNTLHQIRKGDLIYVENGRGIRTTFMVRELRIYNQDDTVAILFDSGDEKAHLNLITCQGIWNKRTKNYSDRLIVFTDKVK